MPSRSTVDGLFVLLVATVSFVGLVEDAVVSALLFIVSLRFLLVAERIEQNLRE
jgi:hypothetical protein